MPLRNTSCQTAISKAVATRGGITARLTRLQRGAPWAVGVSRASSPASSALASSGCVNVSTAMAANLPSKVVGDLDGQVSHGLVLDAARLRDVDPPLTYEASRSRRHQDDPLAQAYGLADVVRDEDD